VVTEPHDRPPVEGDEVRRALRAGRDAGLGYGFAATRAGLRAAIGLGKAGTDLAFKVLDRSPVGEAAGSVADRLEPAAERARRQRAATADEVEVVVGAVVNEVVRLLNVDGIVRQVDVDAVIQRVDVDGIVSRLDIEDIISRVDVDGIVRRTEVGTLIVQSTGGMLTQLLDFVRSLGVSLDAVATKATDRVLHGGKARPVAPVLLARSSDGLAEAPVVSVAPGTTVATVTPGTPVVAVPAPPTEMGA
jgi:hypothetical protein